MGSRFLCSLIYEQYTLLCTLLTLFWNWWEVRTFWNSVTCKDDLMLPSIEMFIRFFDLVSRDSTLGHLQKTMKYIDHNITPACIYCHDLLGCPWRNNDMTIQRLFAPPLVKYINTEFSKVSVSSDVIRNVCSLFLTDRRVFCNQWCGPVISKKQF